MEIARLLAGFGLRNEADVPLKLRMEAYLDALADIPAVAIVQARQAVIRAEAGIDPRFAPSPPEFATLARRLQYAIRSEAARCQAIADAVAEPEEQEPTQAEKDRVTQVIAETMASLIRDRVTPTPAAPGDAELLARRLQELAKRANAAAEPIEEEAPK